MKRIGKIMITALLAVSLVAWASASEAWSGHGRLSHGHRLHRNGHHFKSQHFHGHYRSVWRGPGLYWRGSVVLGPWYPHYYGPWHPYYYYAPPPLIGQGQPRIYVQPEQQPADYWYYCQDPQGYYPYVKKCPDGWMKVVPEVSPPNQ
jgi:hypothetical protein